MLKIAYYYIRRKKTRSISLLCMLTLILLALTACIDLVKQSNQMEASLYQASQAAYSIRSKDPAQPFDLNQVQSLQESQPDNHWVRFYEGNAQLSDLQAVTGSQKIQRDDLTEGLKNNVALYATDDSAKHVLFNSQVFQLVSGRALTDKDRDKILVHEEFAKANGLKLHDLVKLRPVSLEGDPADQEAVPFEIVGIFQGKRQEQYTGVSSDLSENTFFMDYLGSQALLMKGQNNQLTQLNGYAKDPQALQASFKAAQAWAKDHGQLDVIKDSQAYDQILSSIKTLKSLFHWVAYGVMFAGWVILTAILLLWLRERLYEIGVLLAIGRSKVKILGQFLAELVFLSLPALVLSVLLQPLMLKPLLASLNFGQAAESMNSLALKASTGLPAIITLLQAYGLLMIIVVLAVSGSSAVILSKRPSHILAKIS